ncbi:MAG: alpha-amylase, partial [Deinococcota bacterium]|nr:alpha-amylase [Deinococcota bacterium]
VIEHPHWFVSLDESPFPSYTFNGPDLSQDERVGIFLEDHYYDRSDAAVVFKRLDRQSGDASYIYHGNDGTSMPWNDTAQLDYLKAEVREAVIQTILHVAGKFPVIRFDAAMTLAKQHIQRLWYPHPGTGGAIASRAEHGMTKAEFDALMPTEFWREVVDRVAKERPDTLLLAEAFWMMEGYFVRTLGMHRVYNSAFMHMLKGEDNGKYRSLMKNVLEFDPEILKRFVNFMNNPDEETAVAQFGKDDKYFGVCLLMVTLPGLPMFGHGQVEGLFEKYGMEYRRARWQEQPNEGLIRRHEHEIFPLLHKRYLFAEVENFLLYDFYAGGHVNENVFAYSNRAGEERALVVFHNKFSETRGWIKTSVAFSVKRGEERGLERRSLAEGLGLSAGDGRFVTYRDAISGLEYLRSSTTLARDGLYIHLGAFKYQVFLDFRELSDNEHRHYAQLERSLQGRGVPSIEEARCGLELEPLLNAFRAVVNAGVYEKLLTLAQQPVGASQETLLEVETGLRALFSQRNRYAEPVDEAALVEETLNDLRTLLDASEPSLGDASAEDAQLSLSLFCTSLNLIFLKGLRPLEERWAEGRAEGDSWLDRWFLSEPLAQAMRGAGLEEQRLWHTLALTRVLLRQQGALKDALREGGKESAKRFLTALLDDPPTRDYLLIHPFEGVNYFNKEAFEQLYRSLLILPRLNETLEQSLVEALIAEFEAAQAAADYKVEALRGYFEEAVTDEAPTDEATTADTKALEDEPAASAKDADGVGDTAKDISRDTAKDTMKDSVEDSVEDGVEDGVEE